jgi:hypothetical protein
MAIEFKSVCAVTYMNIITCLVGLGNQNTIFAVNLAVDAFNKIMMKSH